MGKIQLLFWGSVSIFAGAWMRYMIGEGCDSPSYLAAHISAGVVVLFGISLIILAFRRRKSMFPFLSL